jgi:predicted Rossmann-fold nucleotide-binding protein
MYSQAKTIFNNLFNKKRYCVICNRERHDVRHHECKACRSLIKQLSHRGEECYGQEL